MWSNQKKRSAFTMVEMMVSAAVGSFILGALILGSVTIHRSFYSTNHYAAQINNETRLMDYVAQDLRRAMRVGVIISGTYHKLEDRLDAIKTTPRELAVTETNILAITIPDYYGSNSPDNTKGSAFKSSRYARSTLNTSQTYNSAANALLNGCVPWSDALVTGANGYIRYAPTSASTGLIQVRYYRGPRSA
ncbi:MAG: prepilin-type N-terminal cleavage/methylation domain-containing protein, partial [Verrucomicrobiota bacterium]